MTRPPFNLVHAQARANAVQAVIDAPHGYQVIIKEAKRTTAQSDHMWSLLTDISKQLVWDGEWLDKDDWRDMMMSVLKYELRTVRAPYNRGRITIGRRSSKLTKAEMSDLIEIIFKFGAEHGVKFYDERAVAE